MSCPSRHATSDAPDAQVAGTSGKVHVDGDSDDEGASTEAHGAAITEALGWQRRNEVTCSLQTYTRVAMPPEARLVRPLVALGRSWRVYTWHGAMLGTPCARRPCMCGRRW